MDKSIKNILICFLIVLIFYLLTVMSKILLPLVLALLFALIFQPLVMQLKRMKFPNFLVLPIIVIFTLAILYLIGEVISSTVVSIMEEKDFLTERLTNKFTALLNWYNDISGSRYRTKTFFEQIYKQMDKDWITNAFQSIAGSITSFTGDFVMFSLYYIVLLAGLPKYKRFIKYVGGDNGEMVLEQYEKVQKSVISYMLIKTLINLTLGISVYVLCTLFEIKFAIFWGFLMFLLHYVPSIGATIGSIPPVLMLLIQNDNLGTALLFAIGLFVLQFIVGNMIEPKVMGNKLKLNTLTVLFGLVFWGFIWGIPGMILSVPMFVIIKLIMERIPDLSIVARIMGSPDHVKEGLIE